MPETACCRMVVSNATKPRFGSSFVTMRAAPGGVPDGEEPLTPAKNQADFRFSVDNPDFLEMFERGKEYYVTVTPVEAWEEKDAEVSEDTPKPADDADESGEDDEDAGADTDDDDDDEDDDEVAVPAVPDVPVADLREHVAGVNNPAWLEAWIEQDDRTTATPIYEARLQELAE